MRDLPPDHDDRSDTIHPAEREALARWRRTTRWAPAPAVAVGLIAAGWWWCVTHWTELPPPSYRALARGYLPLWMVGPPELAFFTVAISAPFQLFYCAVSTRSVRAAFAPDDPGRRTDMLMVPGFADAAARTIRVLLRRTRLPCTVGYLAAALIATMPLGGALCFFLFYEIYDDVLIALVLPFPMIAGCMVLWPELLIVWTRARILREAGALRRAAAATAGYAGLFVCCGYLPSVMIPIYANLYNATIYYALLTLNLVTAFLLWRSARRRRVIDPEVQLWAERLADPSR